jgi:hypothetical protein
MKLNEFWSGLDMRLKLFLTVVAVCSTLTGIGFKVYDTFAKENEFKQFVAMYHFDRERERKKELRQIIFECKTRYGADYSTADELTKQMCRDAEIELESLKDKG